MGAYIYALRSKTVPVVHDGKIVNLNPATYAYKPIGAFGGQPRGHAARMARTENIFDAKGWPDMFIIGDPEDGSSVMRGWPKGCTDMYDSFTNCEFVGTLRPNTVTGRGHPKWIVVPRESSDSQNAH